MAHTSPFSSSNYLVRPGDLPAAANRLTGSLFQSASLLPEHYGSQLDGDAMRVDALYALSELLTFAATLEKQFLNYMTQLIRQESYLPRAAGADFSITNLKHARELLDSHAQGLEENARFLRRQRQWQKSDPRAAAVAAVHNALVDDFAYLLALCRTLSARCLEGVSLVTNDAMPEETRKTKHQGEQTRTLALLAFFYLPLSLRTGLFGMNFRELGLLLTQGAVYYSYVQLSRVWNFVRVYL
ncbi:hypothetical protein B0T24DRAFT_710693 [Lasiosphaeria ovina]|uniref:Uncharacterized protein n=1 Tax=Lasiosphaeria ovina TaxID=92902 RepID=A0AAE0JWD9_9PEZI|nr:hypothetical protein B0T24DRAFT_710693 [Lasiosphaeria ovina]